MCSVLCVNSTLLSVCQRECVIMGELVRPFEQTGAFSGDYDRYQLRLLMLSMRERWCCLMAGNETFILCFSLHTDNSNLNIPAAEVGNSLVSFLNSHHFDISKGRHDTVV
ncbi:hypothetical protein GOODEAATRI_008613 [Goodea atripinnis]|uniref:Uncharacterized protein n=1 Tax=Goodea atripinnis TaxID=208336 RepID=A0ABV0MZR2_9TELE